MLLFFGWMLIAASVFLLPVGVLIAVDTDGRIVLSLSLWRIGFLRRMCALQHPEAGKWTLVIYRRNGMCMGEKVLFPSEKKRDVLHTIHFLSEAFQWETVSVDGTVASCDAGRTAILYGILNAVFGSVGAAGNRRGTYRIVPSFAEKKGRFLVSGMFFTSLGKLIRAAIASRPKRTPLAAEPVQ